MRSYFATVKEAFAANLDASLDSLGITRSHGGNEEWVHINCPCCSDTNGSCSIARATGHINCKQCSRKLDLFEWWRERNGCRDDWQAAHQVGELLGVSYEAPKRKRGRTAARMTPDLLDRAIHNLMEDKEAEWARKYLTDAGLWDPAILARFGVGFLDGSIVFAQWNPDGSLRERYRRHTPNAKAKWSWSKLGAGGPVGFWPAVPEIPENADILLCEGEKDVLAAWIKGQLHKHSRPIVAFTWTGGAGSPLASSLMPDTWPKRRVYVCYDNDTWQGPDLDKARAPNPKKLRELERRRGNLLRGVVGKLCANHCEVSLLHVDLDPVDHFGADLRDWLDAGKSFDELPVCSVDEIVDKQEEPTAVSLTKIGDHAGELVEIQGSVSMIENHTLTVPIVSRIKCPMGSKPCCKDCPVARDFVDQEIVWRDHYGHLFNSLMAKDPEQHIIRKMLCKPSACNECSVIHEETVTGSHWRAGAGDDEASGADMVEVISMEKPALSGQVGITGWALHGTKSVGIFATRLDQLDKPEANLDQFHVELLQLTPWNSNDEKTIERYLESVVADYANNITLIYGRPELHIGTMLVAHSALYYELEGHRYRGWLDACFFGGTRRGKSETVKRLFSYWRLGTAFTCMENFSRAGLTVGGSDNGAKMRPGLFPKNNRKMLFLDEFHHMTAGPRDQNVMVHLQSARDEGRVSALKVYGDLKLPAAVRLITAGNYANRNQRTFQFLCQHLQAFYGVPEALSRMDFAWCVADSVKMVAEQVEHCWTPELARALILRAWAMEPHQIHIDPEVVVVAKQIAAEWDAIFAGEDLALHTGVEKYHSLIRIAIAIANVCYSHPQGKENECQVRMVHIRWAIAWMLQCWENLQYDEFSQRRIAARTVTQPFRVEALLTIALDLDDPDHAAIILSRLTEANRIASLQGFIMGNGQIEEPRHFTKWLSRMLRYSAMVETTENQYNIQYAPTEGCLKILRSLINLARDDPDGYAQRHKILSQWDSSPSARTNLPGIAQEPALDPLDVEQIDDDEAIPF